MAFYACHRARISALLHWCLSWLENESIKKAAASTRNAQILSVIVFHIFWRKDVFLRNYLWETELIFNKYCLRNRNCGFHNIHDFAFICIHIKKLIPFAIIQKNVSRLWGCLTVPMETKNVTIMMERPVDSQPLCCLKKKKNSIFNFMRETHK